MISNPIRVDEKGRELLNHGTLAFPCAWYYSGMNQGDVPWHWHEEIELVYLEPGNSAVFGWEPTFSSLRRRSSLYQYRHSPCLF